MNSSHALCGGPRLVQRDPVTDTLTYVGMHSEESTTGQSSLAAVWPLLAGVRPRRPVTTRCCPLARSSQRRPRFGRQPGALWRLIVRGPQVRELV
jgi:hypothetical protein